MPWVYFFKCNPFSQKAKVHSETKGGEEKKSKLQVVNFLAYFLGHIFRGHSFLNTLTFGNVNDYFKESPFFYWTNISFEDI